MIYWYNRLKIKLSLSLLCLISCHFISSSLAQNPGGIAGHVMWLEANKNTYNVGVTQALDGQTVTTWKNLSSANDAIQATLAKEPTFNSSTALINFNPIVKFGGAQSMQLNSLMGAATYTDASVFFVARNNFIQACAVFSESFSAAEQFLIHYPWSDNNMYSDFGVFPPNRVSSAWGGVVGRPDLVTACFSTTATANGFRQELRKDAKSLATHAAAFGEGSMTGHNTPMSIGVHRDGVSYFKGDIGEMVVFLSGVSLAQQQKIESYLGVKYGISLDSTNFPDYYASDGTVIWNGVTNTNNRWSITGLGRDDNSGLMQLQSKNANPGTDILSISVGPTAATNATNASTIAVDKTFLMWGHNNDIAVSNNGGDVPAGAGVVSRFFRVWKAQETGNLTNYELQFDLTGLGFVTPSDLRLLIDKNHNGLFSDETAVGGGVISGASLAAGNTYKFTNVDLNTGDLFTLATINWLQTPLPVELTDFSSHSDCNKTVLTWMTASETNSSYFNLYKSGDGQTDWKLVTHTPAAGTSSTLHQYSVTDLYPQVGTSYYLLQETDLDGHIGFSKSISVESACQTRFTLYPNPARDMLYLESNTAPDLLEVLDISGRLIQSVQNRVNENTMSISLNGLSSGLYFLRITGADGIPKTIKFQVN